MDKVAAYVAKIKDEKARAVAAKARAERTISRCDEKLDDPQKYFDKELSKNNYRAKSIETGEVRPKRAQPQKTDLRKNVKLNELHDLEGKDLGTWARDRVQKLDSEKRQAKYKGFGFFGEEESE